MQLNITGKIIDTRPLADLLVQGEKGTTTLTMVSARYYDGIDLGSLAWEIWGSYRSQDSTVTLAVDKSYDDEQITFSVTLNEYFACYPGAQDITLVGSDASDTQVLKLTGSHAIIIRDNERGTSSILIPSQVSNIEQAVQNCLNAANVASTAASEAAAASRAATEAAEQIETLRASIAAAKSTAEAAQATANGKVSKTGDTMAGGLVVGGHSTILDGVEGVRIDALSYIDICRNDAAMLVFQRPGENALTTLGVRGNASAENAYIGLPRESGVLDICVSGTFTTYVIYQANSSVNIASLVNQITGKQTQKGGVLVFSLANSRPADFPAAITSLYGSGYVIFGSYYQHIQYRADNGVLYTARKTYNEDTWSRWVSYAGTLM